MVTNCSLSARARPAEAARNDNFTVKTVCAYNEHVLRFVMEDTPLRVMLEEFKKGDYHLAMVQRVRQKDDADPVYELSGLVTLEDIVEEILQAEIVDETDVITDNVHKIRRRKTKTKDLTNCFIDNDSLEVISMQLHLVALQFLSANHPAFYSDRINQNVLTKLIKQNTHKIDLSNIQDASTIRLVSAPRNARLYTKKEGSDRFILILEGRVIVTIGNDNMTFEAGPWHSFGKEVLDKLVEICLPVNNEIKPIENKDVKEEANGGPKKVERVKSIASIDSPAHSQTLVTCATSSGITQAMGSDQKRFVTFFPDYSAIVRENCTYLEISAQAYLVAYKTSLIHRVGPNTEEKIVEPFKRSSLQNIPANIGSLAASNASLNLMERQNLINEKGVSNEKLSNGVLGNISPLLQNGKKPIPFFKGSATSLSDEAHIPLIGLDNKKKG
uniref:Cyclic nucleotide-binding domain-containing protein n=1 Tax=Rhabditophanes sp. KR3021 TaxID=114890 RepID=A0AC35U7R1_9BILA